MTPQERDVITGIFDRLKQAGDAPRDPEAERLIADLIARQPYAPYVLAQSVYVQEQAVANLHRQVEQLQAEVQDLRARAERPQPTGGFLSGLFGGGPSAPPPPRQTSVPPSPSAEDSNRPASIPFRLISISILPGFIGPTLPRRGPHSFVPTPQPIAAATSLVSVNCSKLTALPSRISQTWTTRAVI